ncbi:unnamed protein product [Darwinula stevensoni]|uniref:UDP-N-acetylglucosamine diphosphorylase n=1 Tax=Darwinula stevensoni TaxID=69355 RepID=A0A7R8X1V0_9CRUS|nr:unnamed protein product [Darwinula stevensoni]CAG0880493.1 unnamed protein product [Darwinula stevensoni]
MGSHDLKEKLKKLGQDHVLKYYDTLTEDQRKDLEHQVLSLNLEKVVAKFHATNSHGTAPDIEKRMKPLSTRILSSVNSTGKPQIELYRRRGLSEIAEGHVAVLLLAGGQGTRLGVSYPKGMYDVGLPSKKTLYQIQAERIRRLQLIAERQTGRKPSIPWYIMTSEHTKQATVDYFASHNFFGLKSDDIIVFEQGMVPCFTFDGKVIMESPWHIAKSPDGNGGLYRALREQKILTDMHRRGVACLHVYCVDNLLVKVADPVFLGYCLSEEADCGAKVVPKAYANEPVGVVCDVDGIFQVVEYSEVSPATAEMKDGQGNLLFSAGNICNHFFSLDFLQNVANTWEDGLQFHVAKKKIPTWNAETSETVTPTSPNGIKMEKFVFDVFQFAKRFRVWEVERESEFSPVKNADGQAIKDTPSTARRMLYSLHQSYLIKAGATILPSERGLVCEISPLVSYAGENLEKLVGGRTLHSPVTLFAPEEKANQNGTA